MTGRDTDEEHRASTPLELLFDLCFVVAVAAAAARLHHALAVGHAGAALTGYAMVFFAIWWAWMNFTWFASAYDTDDVAYRLLTLVQMAGVLVLAAGVPAAFDRRDFLLVTLGYTVMRVPLVVQWLRVSRDHPERRRTGRLYVAGIALGQALWLGRLLLAAPWGLVAFPVLVVLEVLVPVVAERTGGRTPWHPGHIAERYGLFTLIVLGEVILASTTSVQAAAEAHGLSASLLLVAVGGLLTVFGMWWLYFKRSVEDTLRLSTRSAFVWGYAHYLVFGAVAAVGAAVGVAADVARHEAHVSTRGADLALAGAVAAYLLVLGTLHAWSFRTPVVAVRSASAAVVLVLLAAPGPDVGVMTLLVGLVVATLVAVHVAFDRPGRGPSSHRPATGRHTVGR
ncbi:low temperature requirement protein LtrA [Oryzihumus leptocrescens]|uniref:Low temperature requirement protein LtrA n=2 Tax=Oryzihumus leptocrescens TaxID=297536 RepID=A0A542Z913_9MICO|nr:low temperature requirement protein LtrA [Oryzihumus leptocrescens]